MAKKWIKGAVESGQSSTAPIVKTSLPPAPASAADIMINQATPAGPLTAMRQKRYGKE